MTTTTTTTTPQAYVLYVDHQGHVAPLSRCYHATASRRLSSSVEDRHPPSTITEVDSAFCPQCLSFYDVSTASLKGFCPKPTCKRCPMCKSIAALTFSDKLCYYDCGYCEWNSKEGEIVAEVNVDDGGNVSKEETARVTELLGKMIEEKTKEGTDENEKRFKSMLDALDTVAKEQVRQRNPIGLVGNATVSKKTGGHWSMKSLEHSLLSKQQKSVELMVFGDLKPNPVVAGLFDDSNAKSAAAELLGLENKKPSSMAGTIPLPIPLRPRKSRRCRAELSEGRPGILVKPKLNPLEGDSSLRTGHGQWWKKDSSAVQVIPKVSVLQHDHSDGGTHSFLLKVTNPTLGIVKLRLAGSQYQGEPTWNKGVRSPDLVNVMVDSLRLTHLDASLSADATKDLVPTDLVALNPVDDTFLDIVRNETPPQVKSWKPSDAGTTNARVVATQGDAAWFEFVFQGDLQATNPALALSLQIQVGGGSWESSLIKPKSETTDPDLVLFDVVIVWNSG